MATGRYRHDSLREGTALGAIVATGIWLWLATIGLGELAWVRILGGNLLGAVLTLLVLSRRHPLRDELRQAERAETE